ncbi:hypothetical protein MRX96_010769 [Rhipicephalus microplus]
MVRTKAFLPRRPYVTCHSDKVLGALVVMAVLLPLVQCTCDKEMCTTECLKVGWDYGECCVPGSNAVPDVCKCFRTPKSSSSWTTVLH